VKITSRNIRPSTVLYARAYGPYAAGTRAAWQTMGCWLDAQNRRPLVRVSYGLFQDNPRITAPELVRYDACVPLVMGLEEDEEAGIRRQVFRGGTYAVHTHVGPIEAAGELFSDLYHKEIPARGLTLDEDRPFLAVYLTDPTVTREPHRRTELCVPVVPICMPAAGNDSEPLVAPEIVHAIA
jgi:AraC family transcriptional regulator